MQRQVFRLSSERKCGEMFNNDLIAKLLESANADNRLAFGEVTGNSLVCWVFFDS